MPTIRLGKGAQFSDNTGSAGSPAWRNNKWVRDITRNEEPGGVIDATDRFVDYQLSLATRYKLSYDVDGIWHGNTSQVVFRTAFLAGTTTVDVGVFDRVSVVTSASNGLGHRGDMFVKKFSLEFPLNGEQKLSITCVPYANYTTAIVGYTDITTVLGTADSPGTRKIGKNASINNASDTPLTGIRDWKMSMEWNTVNAGNRVSDFDMELPTQMNIVIEADFAWDASDTTLAAIRTAYYAHTQLTDYTFLDGAFATSGSWGLNADVEVTKLAWKGELKGLQLYSVTMVPRSNYTTAPAFITI